jgi:hypothetical protein
MTQMRDTILALAPPWLRDDSPQSPENPNGGVGGRFLYALGLASDALLEKMNQAQHARMPLTCDASALPIIGNDRVLTQGPGESDAAFRIRLQKAFETWQHAGSSRAVLQLAAAFTAGLLGATGNVPIVATVGGYLAEKWDWLLASSDISAPPIHYQTPTQRWSWDGLEASRWWRAWLILYAHLSPQITSSTGASISAGSGSLYTVSGLVGVPSTCTSPTAPGYLTLLGAASSGNNGTFQIVQWLSSSSVIIANPNGATPDANDGAITASTVRTYSGIQPAPALGFPGASALGAGPSTLAIGVQFTTGDAVGFFAQLRAQVRLWKSANTYYPAIIVSYGGDGQVAGSEFSPWSGEGSGNPDGTWGRWSKIVAGRYVAARVTGVQSGAYDAMIDGTQLYLNCYEPGT